MWPFKKKHKEQPIDYSQLRKVVVGEPTRVKLFRAEVVNKAKYEQYKMYRDKGSYFEYLYTDVYFYKTCKEAFQELGEQASVKQVDAYIIDSEYFIGQLTNITVK